MMSTYPTSVDSALALFRANSGNHIAVVKQMDAIARVLTLGRDAILAYAMKEQQKRHQTAQNTWQDYRLVRREGDAFWTAIRTPDGRDYECETTDEGVKRFIGCGDQWFCDVVNAALRESGLVFRLETKHAMIAHLRERAASQGLLTWYSESPIAEEEDEGEEAEAEEDNNDCPSCGGSGGGDAPWECTLCGGTGSVGPYHIDFDDVDDRDDL